MGDKKCVMQYYSLIDKYDLFLWIAFEYNWTEVVASGSVMSTVRAIAVGPLYVQKKQKIRWMIAECGWDRIRHLHSSISSICRKPPSRQYLQYQRNQLLWHRPNAPNDWPGLAERSVEHVDRRPNRKYTRLQQRPLSAEQGLPNRVLKPKRNTIYDFSHSIVIEWSRSTVFTTVE